MCVPVLMMYIRQCMHTEHLQQVIIRLVGIIIQVSFIILIPISLNFIIFMMLLLSLFTIYNLNFNQHLATCVSCIPGYVYVHKQVMHKHIKIPIPA